jgi:hypothetical protein
MKPIKNFEILKLENREIENTIPKFPNSKIPK